MEGGFREFVVGVGVPGVRFGEFVVGVGVPGAGVVRVERPGVVAGAVRAGWGVCAARKGLEAPWASMAMASRAERSRARRRGWADFLAAGCGAELEVVMVPNRRLQIDSRLRESSGLDSRQ